MGKIKKSYFFRLIVESQGPGIFLRLIIFSPMRLLILVLLLLLAVCSASSPRLLETSPGFHRMRLYGNDTIAYYYANLYIGTPPQLQTVIVPFLFWASLRLVLMLFGRLVVV